METYNHRHYIPISGFQIIEDFGLTCPYKHYCPLYDPECDSTFDECGTLLSYLDAEYKLMLREEGYI